MGRAKGPRKPELRDASGRLPDGRFAPGASGCPGGRALAVTRFARHIKELDGEDGKAIVRIAFSIARGELTWTEYVGKEALPIQAEPSARDRMDAVRWLRENGWGKAVPASELIDPDELPPLTEIEASSAAHLNQAQRLLSGLMSHIERQMQAGVSVSGEMAQALATAVQTLATSAKEERELAKAGAGSALSDADLNAQVVAAMPDDVLRAELERRKGVTP